MKTRKDESPRALRSASAWANAALLVAAGCALVVVSSAAPAQRKGAAKGGKTAAKATTPKGTATTPKASASAAARRPADKSVTVKTEPKAIVWLDELRRGVTDDSGTLSIKNVAAGRHTLRVRARGFSERTAALLPAQRGTVEVRLQPTTDEAELLFQQAEESAAKGVEGRTEAKELYRRALKLRPKFPAAHVALARTLMADDDFNAALEELAAARRDRPVYPEASAVEGRILRELAEYEESIDAFERAIREGRGVQPEAHTGIALVHVDKGDHEAAVLAFRKAISQLADTEPALYQLLGASYEKLEKWKEAVAAYEKYLELAPDGKLAPAVRSIIDQLRQQAAEQQ
jgi:Tfp pilus assembly protein PilF